MIYIGTSGYSYKDWIGPFYPAGTRDSDMLSYYCLNFNFVEINSSYYHMPSIRLFESINRKTQENFKVSVKLFKGFTHERTSNATEAEKFIYSIKPLMESGKLVCLLAQFPYSFHFTNENMDYIKKLREWFKDIDLNVEFRNQGWIRQEVMKMLSGHAMGFVCVDEPDIKGLIRKVSALTSQVSYIRMHGRNDAKWYGGEGSERYNYLYNDDELAEWVPVIKSLDMKAKITVVSFNNHPLGKAVENAKALKKIIQANVF